MRPYTSTLNKALIRHNVCGHEWMVMPSAMIMKNPKGCPVCSQHHVDTDIMRRRINDQTSGEYELLSEYRDQWSPIVVRHNTCGKEYEVLGKVWTAGHRCPRCNRGHQDPSDILWHYHNKVGEPWFEILSTGPIVLRCLECHEELICDIPDAVYRRKECPACVGQRAENKKESLPHEYAEK